MVKEPTQHQTEIITNLFHAASGQAGVFVSGDTIHHSSLFWLEHPCRAMITIRKHKEGRKTYREIALTEQGVLYCVSHGIHAREPIDEAYVPKADNRTRITIAFQLPQGDRAVGLIEGCKEKRDFVPVIRAAMDLYAAIGYKALEAMVQQHGAMIEALQNAQLEIENERKRLELERAALQAQTLEVSQFHNYFKSIDAKLEQLQNTPQTPVFAHSGDLQAGSGSTQARGLKALNVAKIEAPVFDEDDDDLLTVAVDSGAGKKATENFLKSLGALNDTPKD